MQKNQKQKFTKRDFRTPPPIEPLMLSRYEQAKKGNP
jgi:hypothetical protein